MFEELPELRHAALEVYEFEDLGVDKTKLTIQEICCSADDRDVMINRVWKVAW